MSAEPTDLIRRILALRRPLLLAFDVDGTLAPIVTDPAAARVPEATGRALRRLTVADDIIVALLTGRDLPSLEAMIDLPGAWRGVEHGGRLLRPGERGASRALPPKDAARLDSFAEAVRAAGARLERKASSVGAHLRDLGEEDVARISAELRVHAERLGLHVREGRRVLEAELSSGDKGEALATIFTRVHAKSVFFVGDDLTDLPAVEFASQHGIGAFVLSDERPEGPPGAEHIDGQAAMAALVETLSLRT